MFEGLGLGFDENVRNKILFFIFFYIGFYIVSFFFNEDFM